MVKLHKIIYYKIGQENIDCIIFISSSSEILFYRGKKQNKTATKKNEIIKLKYNSIVLFSLISLNLSSMV